MRNTINKATNMRNTTNKKITGRPKSVPTTGLYIVPMNWKSNATPKKPKKNLCSSSGTNVMRNTTNQTITGRLRLNLLLMWEVKVGYFSYRVIIFLKIIII